MSTPAKIKIDPESINALLALDVAQNLYSVDEILERHDLTKDQFRQILHNDHFRNLHREKRDEWRSDAKAPERVQVKSQMAFELYGITTIISIINDSEVSLPIKLDAIKYLGTLAGVVPEKQRPESGPIVGGFTLNISVPRPDGSFERTVIGNGK